MQRKLFISLAVLLFPVIVGCGSGASSNANNTLPATLTRQVDEIIADQMQIENLPGVSVGIWIPGRGRYVTAQGAADLTTGAARDTAAPFRIASITKTFTATAILQLADGGRLNVTDRLSTWYPDFPNADRITVDHLLRMRSGIPDSLDASFLAEYFADPTAPVTAEDVIARSATRASEFTNPDEKTVYANINYVLLERIVEKVSGKSLGVYIHDHILAPLRMSQSIYPTGFDLPGPLHGYSMDANGVAEDKTVLNPAPAGGAGAMISTMDDLHIYARALGRGTLLKPTTQEARLRSENISGDPDFVRYGQGIVRIGKFYGHNGTIFGFSSEMWYLPEREAVIVINVNRLDLDDESKSAPLFFRIAKALFPDDVNW